MSAQGCERCAKNLLTRFAGASFDLSSIFRNPKYKAISKKIGATIRGWLQGWCEEALARFLELNISKMHKKDITIFRAAQQPTQACKLSVYEALVSGCSTAEPIIFIFGL